jgi:hypothetical protein
MTAEHRRLEAARTRTTHWKRWGPYVSDRAWGTVREDYSPGGTAWEYLRNYKLNAGNYVTHRQDTLKRNQFGANLGGPIVKNRAFFFFNWESQRERSTIQPLGSVFTQRMRTGDLGQFTDVIRDPERANHSPAISFRPAASIRSHSRSSTLTWRCQILAREF